MLNGLLRTPRIAYASENGSGGAPGIARPLVPGIPSRVVDPSGVVKQQMRSVRPEESEAPKAVSGQGRLVVGEEIGVSGQIGSCDTLVVHGTVEAELPGRAIEIGATGRFRGTAEVDEAIIAGRFEGTLTVRRQLTVAPGGRIDGTVRYRELTVEAGGRIVGEMQHLDEVAAETPSQPVSPQAETEPASSGAAEQDTPEDKTTDAVPEREDSPQTTARRRFQQRERARRLRELAESDA